MTAGSCWSKGRRSQSAATEIAERAAPALLFGLAPCGVCPASGVATRAVRSYIKAAEATRTFSPLLRPANGMERYIFCGTFRTGGVRPDESGILHRPSPLASTLPCGVRTFLSPAHASPDQIGTLVRGSDRPACSRKFHDNLVRGGGQTRAPAEQRVEKDQRAGLIDLRSSILNFRILKSSFCVGAALFLASFLNTPTLAQEPTATSSKEALLTQADEVLEEMSKLTGLPIKGALKKKVLSRPEIRKFLEETLDAEYPPEQIHKQESTLKAFGLVSRDFELREFLLTFYTEQAAGVYDPRSKTMILADWTSAEMQRLVLPHEITHALQDQNFDLLLFTHAEKDNDDSTAARQAVMEGHATAAMMQQMTGGAPLASLPSLQPMLEGVLGQQFAEFPTFNQAPYFFRLEALFPYIQGMGFVQRALQVQGGWAGLNSLFQKPPTQTREIYDPKLYFDGPPPERVTLARPPVLEGDKALRLLDENTMGQLGYMALLGQLISEEEAKSLAPHWRADRYIVYENETEGSYALVARTRWSGPETALSFFRHNLMILAKKYPELSPDPRSTSDLFIGTIGSGKVMLLRKGNECRWAEGVPEEKTESMLKWLESL
jgi:hypothetical protein